MDRLGVALRGRFRVPAGIAGAIVGLGIAAVYAVVWPSDDAGDLAPGVHRFVLRWAHPAVWLVLAAAAALFAARTPTRTVARIATVGLVLYGAFILALILA